MHSHMGDGFHLPRVLFHLPVHDFHAPFLGFLALIPACWSAVVFCMLVVEWYNGNPEGERAVDSLLQSERGVFLESFRQYLHRITAEDETPLCI
jgi:hypothetical protein